MYQFAVDFLLLMAVSGLDSREEKWYRCVLGAGIGGMFGWYSFLRRFPIPDMLLFLPLMQGVICLAAFGLHRQTLQKGILFTLLDLALSGIAYGIGHSGFSWIPMLIGFCVLLCISRYAGNREAYVPVEIRFRGKTVAFPAFRDTGNQLRDPLTGKRVLIVGADAARELLGIGAEQLRHPAEAVASGKYPGLRLVPYCTIGQQGLLAAIRIEDVRIGSVRESTLVAFAPEGLGKGKAFQALTGGTL